MIRVEYTIEAGATKQTLKRARRESRKRSKAALKRSGERIVLPAAHRRAQRHVGPHTRDIVVKATGTYAFLTGRTVQAGRILGLEEFGGTVRTPIKPRRRGAEGEHAPALKLGSKNVFVAGVTKPRVHKAHHFLIGAVEDTYPRYEHLLLGEVLKAFDPLEHTP